ncbi:TRAP transporter small permease [Rubritalea tangerina]|uniref:TRAP transporter small permease n=1 Tax=Rubritalea tangerina TaxID=430798 RepID=A0ABW4ZF72_9BACT
MMRFTAASCLLALLLIVILGILSKRLTLHITWTVELAEFLLAWLVMLGGALAYIEHAHLGVDLLSNHLDSKAKTLARGTSHLLIAGFSIAVLIIGGSQLFFERWNAGQMLPALGIHKAWFYLSGPIVGLIIAITALYYTWDALNQFRNHPNTTKSTP